jgi:hypothetical protein
VVAGILPCRSGVGRSSRLWVSHASRRAGKPQPVFLPPYSPELNPIERLWLHLRDNRLSHCVFQTTGEIVDTYCDAWNWLSGQSHWLAQEAALEFGRFRMLLRRRQLIADGVPIRLGTRAFDLLTVLLEADGSLVTSARTRPVRPKPANTAVRTERRAIARSIRIDRDRVAPSTRNAPPYSQVRRFCPKWNVRRSRRC